MPTVVRGDADIKERRGRDLRAQPYGRELLRAGERARF
jgi:hypothetical protein